MKLRALSLVILTIFAVASAFGQTCSVATCGEPEFSNGTSPVAVGKQIDASQFAATSGDNCLQLNSCLRAVAAISGAGGTCNAESLVGTLTCNSNPWAGIGTPGLRLQLGGAKWNTTAQWIIPNGDSLKGIIRGPFSVPAGTTIVWTGSAASLNTPVVCLGPCSWDSTVRSGIQVEDMAVDCNSAANMIGFKNASAQEQSWLKDVDVYDCPVNGILVSGNGAQNSGPYDNFTVSYPSPACLQGTVPVFFSGVPGVNRGSRWTITAKGCAMNTSPQVMIELSTQGLHLDSIHCEDLPATYHTACIEIGGSGNASSISIDNVVACSTPNYCYDAVLIATGHTVSDISLTTLQALNPGGGPFTNLVRDLVNNITLTSSTGALRLAKYTFGQQSAAGIAPVTTTSNQTGRVLPCANYSNLPGVLTVTKPPTGSMYCCPDCSSSTGNACGGGGNGYVAIWLGGSSGKWICD